MLKHLQNGSDIRGIAITTNEHSANLTPNTMTSITSGIINWLKQSDHLLKRYQEGQLVIGIGRDSRLSGPDLVHAFIQQATQEGVHVIDFGLATTPSMFMSTQYESFQCDAAIMITASHLPVEYNGVKIFTQQGGAEHEDIAFILEHTSPSNNGKLGTVVQHDLLPIYSKDLLEKIRKGSQTNTLTPLKDMHIIVDAGNGAGGFFAEHVLKPLGANIDGSQFLEPDGHFPNHVPNPDNKEAIESIKQAVLANQADLGIIFDTDVDRSAVITKEGMVLNRNNFIALLSHIVLTEHPNAAIVTNSETSEHLHQFINNLGGQHIRYKSGYRNVINRAIQANQDGIDCHLAIETSGHAAFKENYFLDDGTYAVAKVLMLLSQLNEQNKTIDDLLSTLKQPAETIEIRFFIDQEPYRPYGEEIIDSIEKLTIDGWTLDTGNVEGVRFSLSNTYGKGWFILRMSLHEPLLVFKAEQDILGYLPTITNKIVDILSSYPNIIKK